MQSSREQLESATFTLEKQKELNEKLEIDLLSINKENGGRPSGDSEQDILNGLDLDATGPMNCGLVREIKTAGLKLYAWTIDSPADARKLMKVGVDGITTDYPDRLAKVLRTRGIDY